MRTEQLMIYVAVIAAITLFGEYGASKTPELENVVEKQEFRRVNRNDVAEDLREVQLRDDDLAENYLSEVGQLRSDRLFQRSFRDTDDAKANTTTPTAKPWGKVATGLGVARMAGWASSAYSSIPSMSTVASYIPGKGVLKYILPSSETIQSYLPSLDTIKAYIPQKMETLSRQYSSPFNPAAYLTKNDTDQLVDAMSQKILKGEKVGNITSLSVVGRNVTQRVVNSASSALMRMVVQKVVSGLAVNAVGIAAAYFGAGSLTQLADGITEKAVAQCQSLGVCSVDMFSYLKNMHWADIGKSVFNMLSGAAKG